MSKQTQQQIKRERRRVTLTETLRKGQAQEYVRMFDAAARLLTEAGQVLQAHTMPDGSPRCPTCGTLRDNCETHKRLSAAMEHFMESAPDPERVKFFRKASV